MTEDQRYRNNLRVTKYREKKRKEREASKPQSLSLPKLTVSNLDPLGPTKTRPGTEARTKVYADRFSRGVDVMHPEDRWQ